MRLHVSLEPSRLTSFRRADKGMEYTEKREGEGTLENTIIKQIKL